MKKDHQPKDLYQEVTDKVIAEIEAGKIPWIKPWTNSGHGGLPYNVITGKPYRGINSMILFAPGAGEGWLTYKQASQVGAQVRKGERGSMIVFFKPLKIEDKNAPADAADKSKTIPMLKYFTVFHTSQVDNLPEKYQPKVVEAPSEKVRIEAAEALLAQARINHGGDRAFYRIETDSITLPQQAQFKSVDDYYATALHELTHWTGHSTRCAREYGKRFGDTAYAREELVAEMGAAFLCAKTGITGKLQHAAYLQSWLGVLKADKRALLVAAGAAQKAADFVTGYKVEEQAEDEQQAA
jgi:antirestriction protein ArdC